MSLEENLSQAIANEKNLVIREDNVKILNKKDPKYKPICKQNVAYIVSIILIDDKDQICLIQEAKKSCRGKWYIPAGRMEKNEDLYVAAKRECLEETGYIVEPVSLCSIELSPDGQWYRFTFIALITGGSLKTTEQADSESLQASWFEIESLKNKANWNKLRTTDFLKLMELGSLYYKKFNFNSMSKQPLESYSRPEYILPMPVKQEYNLFTFVILNKDVTSYLVLEDREKDMLPSAIIEPFEHDQYSINYGIESVVFPKCFKDFNYIKYNINGALMLFYDGKETQPMSLHDGLHIAFILTVFDENFENNLKDPFKCRPFPQNNLASKMKQNLSNDLSFIKVIRT